MALNGVTSFLRLKDVTITCYVSNSPTAMSPRMNSSENITATGLGCFVANRNKWGDLDFFCHRIILN